MKTPKPFCFNKSKVKAFVLGADPTNFSKNNNRVDLDYVFGIGQNPNYFRQILQNLNDAGLHLEDIYLQNLLPEYQDKETGKNKEFKQNALENTEAIAKEFNKIDSSKKTPVFLTAYDIYEVVLNDDEAKISPLDIYNLKTEIPIPAEKNKLMRPLIPLFRHSNYAIADWPLYKEKIKEFIGEIA